MNTTPAAVATFNMHKARVLFNSMGTLTDEECDARAEVMLEDYVTTLNIEASAFLTMVETGILPACVEDVTRYAAMPELAGNRKSVYLGIKTESDEPHKPGAKLLHDIAADAKYDVIKPQMLAVRRLVDEAEGLLERGLYPYPTYEELIYSHHS